jgi:xanthine dehydrogenase accessory factor
VSDLLERLAAIQERGGPRRAVHRRRGRRRRREVLVEEGETPTAELAAEADEVIRGARNALLELRGAKVFAEVYMPPPRLFVYGAVDTAEALCQAAKLLGWSDDRRRRAGAPSPPASASPAPTSLIVEWPDEAIAEVAPDHQTASSSSPTTPSSTSPRCEGILATEAFYSRRPRLPPQPGEAPRAAARGRRARGGARAHRRPLRAGRSAPRVQEETALSILGEILAVRAGRPGGRLKDAKRRIHAQEDAHPRRP